jgi:hypothetical protein
MAKPELISSSGDNFATTGQQITWSLGEVAIETSIKGNLILTQGFHQCSYLVTAVDETILSDLEITAFPNPATDFLSVQLSGDNLQLKDYVLNLTDIQGKQLLKVKPDNNCPRINFSAYEAGTYFLSISKNAEILRTFKIIKSE